MAKLKLPPTATSLASEHCEACRADAPRVSEQQLEELLRALPKWQLIAAQVAEQEVMQLNRSYSFANFVDALAFANRVGELAERADHHPAILLEWGKVSVTWWTHKIAGLHHNDFIMAARTDQLFNRGSSQ